MIAYLKTKSFRVMLSISLVAISIGGITKCAWLGLGIFAVGLFWHTKMTE